MSSEINCLNSNEINFSSSLCRSVFIVNSLPLLICYVSSVGPLLPQGLFFGLVWFTEVLRTFKNGWDSSISQLWWPWLTFDNLISNNQIIMKSFDIPLKKNDQSKYRILLRGQSAPGTALFQDSTSLCRDAKIII